ncbi:hypothetical protein [Corynebacterium belfantii]|uniref:hypothetical protein n=1 Tax=Corynebacterium belfantii TaxID=2014537 RepID=UPI000B4B1EE4|nr:hypothetical protein [Corynebacterium belfantii]OWM36109.1 hypothetical protein AZF07_11515 [Corynebacterium diphtheriae subsp. lausannense]SNW32721.1 hypothetical protein FRC0043_02331 [Corynebacterium belfantii]
MPKTFQNKLDQKTSVSISPEFDHKLNDGRPEATKWFNDAAAAVNAATPAEAEALIKELDKIDP